MAVGMKLVPGIIKLQDQDLQIVKIGTEIVTHPHNTNLYRIWVADGRINKKAKRWKKKWLKEYNIPKSHLVTISGSLRENTEPRAVCCISHICNRDVAEQIEGLNERIVYAEKLRDEAMDLVVNILSDLAKSGMKPETFDDLEKIYQHKLAMIIGKKHGKKK